MHILAGTGGGTGAYTENQNKGLSILDEFIGTFKFRGVIKYQDKNVKCDQSR